MLHPAAGPFANETCHHVQNYPAACGGQKPQIVHGSPPAQPLGHPGSRQLCLCEMTLAHPSCCLLPKLGRSCAVRRGVWGLIEAFAKRFTSFLEQPCRVLGRVQGRVLPQPSVICRELCLPAPRGEGGQGSCRKRPSYPLVSSGSWGAP